MPKEKVHGNKCGGHCRGGHCRGGHCRGGHCRAVFQDGVDSVSDELAKRINPCVQGWINYTNRAF